jgi:hypothetical protein
MIKEGILGKFGKPTEQTPKNWRDMLYDVSASAPVSSGPKVNLEENQCLFIKSTKNLFLAIT